MFQLPDIPNILPEWKKALPNIETFIERRNLTYQNTVQENIHLYQHNETGLPYFVIFILHDKLGIEHFKIFLHLSENTIVRNIILIYQNIITTNCLKVIDNLFQYNLELFRLDTFQFDITSLYYYVPHIKISDTALLGEIHQKYGNNLPTLLKNDPIVHYFGFKRNDVIKIIRSPNEFIYRIVR